MVTKTGTEGNDTLKVDGSFDAPVDTILLGLGGDDFLTGGFGANTLVGGDGNDQFFFRHGADDLVDGNFVFVEDTRPDSFEGGNGTDTLWMSTTLEERTAFGDNVGFRVDLLTGTDDGGNSFTGIENMRGSQGNDTLGGDDGANFITGDAGDDRLTGRGGDDTLFGDKGDDILEGGSGNDILHGGDGSDLLLGGAGNDRLQGSWFGLTPDLDTRADRLRGGGGDDDISSFSGHGEIDGGTGDDRIVVAISGEFEGPITLTIDGGAGFDTLQFGAVGAVGLLSVDWTAGILHTDDGRQVRFSGIERINFEDKPEDVCERGTAGADRFLASGAAECFDGLAGRDTVIYRNSGAAVKMDLRSGTGANGFAEGDQLRAIESLRGSQFGDVLNGSATRNALDGLRGNDALRGFKGNDALRGGGGDDGLFGGEGNDALRGGAGDDFLRGGSGADILRGDAGSDTLFGDRGNDELFGDDGSDDLWGGDGNDGLFGGDGNDTLRGGNGADTLRGGNGDDMLIFSTPGDRFFGGNGSDEVSFASLPLGVGIDLLGSNPGNWTEHQLSTETVLSGIEGITGSLSDDRIFGTTGNDAIFGNAGDDKLYGGGGEDRLDGNAGDDRFWLGRGSLELVTGGAGADRFVLNSVKASIPGSTPHPAERPSDVVIEDFTLPTPGVRQVEDRLILRGFGAGFDEAALFASASQEGADILFQLPDDLSLLLENVDLTDFMSVATTIPGLVDFV